MVRQPAPGAGTTEGPLAGIAVVDLGWYLAAPMTSLLLADLGATVVRVLPPGGPELPEPQFRALHRNKQLVTIDLRTGDGLATASELLASADVAVESFRPGVMARRGLGPDVLCERNPRLVHLSLPGFAGNDPERSTWPGWEGLVGAVSGLYTTGLRQALDAPPIYQAVPIASAFASVHGAIAVVSALFHRTTTGRGTRIEVPLDHAARSACTRGFVFKGSELRAVAEPGRVAPPLLEPLALRDDDPAAVRDRKLRRIDHLMPPNYTTHRYRAADGRRMQIMPIKPAAIRRLLSVLGLEAEVLAEGFVCRDPWDRFDVGSDADLASSWTMDPERNRWLIDAIQEVVAKEPSTHWSAVLSAAGIPHGTLRTRAEWLGIEAHRESGLLMRMDGAEPVLDVPGRLVDVDGPGGVAAPTATEPRAVDRAAAAASFARAPAPSPAAVPAPAPASGDADRPVRKGDLLAGVRVLDLCNVVAGPNAAYTLAQYGADVVRVEPPRSFNLPMHLGWTLEVNQGKRSVVLDITSVPGRAVFERLLAGSDCVVHNRLDDVAARLGLTTDRLHEVAPDLVVGQVSAFGGTFRTGTERQPGYDPMPNMETGLDVTAGSFDDPRHQEEILSDLMGGLAGALALVAGLYQRRVTGHAGECRASLARGANHVQLPLMVAVGGRAGWGEPTGPGARGVAPGRRMYRCADDWLFVWAGDDQIDRLHELVAGAPTDDPGLEAAFRTEDRAAWAGVLRAAGIAAAEVTSLDDLCLPEGLREVGNDAADEVATGSPEVLVWPEHPSGLAVALPAPSWVQVGAERSYRRLEPVARVGQHSREVLVELGCSDEEIAALYQLGVVHDHLPAIGDDHSYFFRQQEVPAPVTSDDPTDLTDLTDLTDRLAAVEAREAIRDLVATYCYRIAAKDLDGVLTMFTDDLVVEILGRTYEGEAGLRRLYGGALATDPKPFMHNLSIELLGPDEARSACTAEIRSGPDYQAGSCGVYHDHYRRVDGAWKFARRSFAPY